MYRAKSRDGARSYQRGNVVSGTTRCSPATHIISPRIRFVEGAPRVLHTENRERGRVKDKRERRDQTRETERVRGNRGHIMASITGT